jgi:hypothetical protein
VPFVEAEDMSWGFHGWSSFHVWWSFHAFIHHVRRLHERIFPASEAPFDWMLDLTRTPNVYCPAFILSVIAGICIIVGKSGFAMTATIYCVGFCLLTLRWSVWTSGFLNGTHARSMMAITYILVVAFCHWGLIHVPCALFVHRSCGFLAVLWRLLLPYYTLHMRPAVLCTALLTVVEQVSTAYILDQFGHRAEIPRVLSVLALLSCVTPLWCWLNAFMWHAMWSTQVQLAAEKESFKSLLSMVCDATFWLSRDGDTILRSSRQFDAILGQHAEQSRLSEHMPDAEASRLDTALSGRCMTSLPTSILQDGIATNVDLFIVPCRPLSGKQEQGDDPLEPFGNLVGVRVSQPFMDSSEANRTQRLPNKLQASVNQTIGIPEDGLRRRRRVTFSDPDDATNPAVVEKEEGESADNSTSSITSARHLQSALAASAKCVYGSAFGPPFTRHILG